MRRSERKPPSYAMWSPLRRISTVGTLGSLTHFALPSLSGRTLILM